MKNDKLLNLYTNILRVTSLCISIFFLINGNIKVICIFLLFYFLSIIPYILNKFFQIKISNLLSFVYITLIFGANFLGNGLRFYKAFFWWDISIHFLSGILCFLIGLYISRKYKINIKERIIFILLITLSLSLCWELFEFICDSIFKSNMQEWKTMSYEPFISYVENRGHGLVDSMMDMIYAIMGFILSLIIYLKNNKKET